MSRVTSKAAWQRAADRGLIAPPIVGRFCRLDLDSIEGAAM